MAQVHSSTSTVTEAGAAVSADVAPAIDDEAYLMTMVEADALLPSNLALSGLFDGDNALNADELNDIASLLAPPNPAPVSDDEASASVPSSEASTPVSTVAPVLVTSSSCSKAPPLPKLVGDTNKTTKESLVSVAAANHKRRFGSSTKDSAPALKKSKLVAKTKPRQPALADAILKSSLEISTGKPKGTTTITTTTKTKKFPALAPKPSVAKPLPKPPRAPASTATTTATTTLKAVIAPCIQQPDEVVSNSSSKPANASKTTTTTAVVPAGAATSSAKANATSNNTTITSKPPLTQEERAQQCRDRNRQHARNTRLRKKAYIEELKRQLLELVEQRDADLAAETQKTKIVEQQREVRFQVMQDFLQLRGRNEGNPRRWAAILEEGFSLTLPQTTFQTMVNTTAANQEQLLKGVTEIMADSNYFATFLQSLGDIATTHNNNNNDTVTHTTTTTTPITTTTGDDANIPPITFVYHCNRSNFLMDDCNAILSWTANSSGAVARGASKELELCGSMRAKFCPRTNRMEMAKIQFDTGAIRSQL